MLLVLWVAVILNFVLAFVQGIHSNTVKPSVNITFNTVNSSRKGSRSKIKSEPLTTPKLNPPSLNEKIRNFRKIFRKIKSVSKLDGNQLAYEDVSDPLQYNYKDIWWTNKDHSTTIHPTKINLYHKEPTEIATTTSTKVKPSNITETTKETTQQALRNVKTTTKKLYVEVTENLSNTTQNTTANKQNETMRYFRFLKGSKMPARTGSTKRKFVDKFKGNLLPVFSRDKNGQFSLLTNETNLVVKRNENDGIPGSIIDNILLNDVDNIEMFDFAVINTNNDPKKNNTIRFVEIINTDNIAEDIKKRTPMNIAVIPTQSAIFPQIIKDGIYRIEIPKPVIRTTRARPEESTGVDLAAPGYDRPFSPLNARNGPRPNYPNPYFNPNMSPNRQGPFYNSQNAQYNRQKSHYGQNFVGNGRPYPQNHGQGQRPFRDPSRQGPFGNNHYPGNNRHSPYGPNIGNNIQDNGPNNIGLWQGPYGSYYNPQNPGLNRQRPRPNYQPINRNRLPQNVYNQQIPNGYNSGQRRPPFQNTYNQNMADARNVLRDWKYSTLLPTPIPTFDEMPVIIPPSTNDTQGLVNMYTNMVFGVGETRNPTEYVTTSTFTTETLPPDVGPMLKHAPVPEEEDIGPISEFVEECAEEMKKLKMGYFSIFLIKFFEIVAKKKPEPLGRLFNRAQFQIDILFNQDTTMAHFGEPFCTYFRSMATKLDSIAIDLAQSAAVMLHHGMINRRQGLASDINSFIDYADTLFEDIEGIELLRALEEIKKYPEGEPNSNQVHQILYKALFQPIKRLSGSQKRQRLIDSLNQLIKNHETRRSHRNQYHLALPILDRYDGYTKDYQQATTGRSVTHKKKRVNKLLGDFKIYETDTTKNIYVPEVNESRLFKNAINNAMSSNRIEDSTKRIAKIEDKWTKNFLEFNNRIQATTNHKISKDIRFISPILEGSKAIFPKNLVDASKVTYFDRYDKDNDDTNDIFGKTKVRFDIESNNVMKQSFNDHFDFTTPEIILSKEKSITKPAKIMPELTLQQSEKTKKRKHSKIPKLSKKERKHLLHKHPKIYKKYLRHIRSKHKDLNKKKHKKKSHRKKKKTHHLKKKKTNKHSKLKHIDHHFKHVINKYMPKKARPKAKIENTGRVADSSESSEYTSEEYTNLRNRIQSKEENLQDDRSKALSIEEVAFITPINRATFLIQDGTTVAWMNLPLDETDPQKIKMNLRKPFSRFNKNFLLDSSQNSDSMEVFDVKFIKDDKNKEINRVSSYSDEEYALKTKLYDAMRHDGTYIKPERRSFVKPKKNKLRAFSSYSSEEIVLKSNIYKAAGFNNSRANFSEIVREDENKHVNSFRRKFGTVNEMSSYSDEENILKEKIKNIILKT